MPQREAQPMRALIPGALKQVQQCQSVLFAVRQRWGALVGKALAAHATPVSFQRGRLVIAVDRPGDSFTLSYQRERLLKQLKAATRGKVEEVVIRPGNPPRRTDRDHALPH